MSRISTFSIGAAAALFALPAAASAQEFDETCRNGLFPDSPPFSLAEINGEGRAYFHGDMHGCPAQGDCRENTYVVPGDTVIVSKVRSGFGCVFYPGSATAGYIALDRLRFMPVGANPPVSDWLGRWEGAFDEGVSIEMDGDALYATGFATWRGGPTVDGNPVIHTGEFEGPISVFGNRGFYTDGFCEVEFTLLGDVLLADDNAGCGGVNVRVRSVYSRGEDLPSD